MEEKDKYDHPSYSVMANWKVYALILAPLVTSIGVFSFLVRKSDLTFDSQRQKYDSIEHYESPSIHTSYKDKAEIIILKQKQNSIIKTVENTAREQVIIKENQVKIGQDLMEIKALIKKIDK